MGTITRPYTYSAGNTITASENTSNETTVYDEFNGNVDGANFKADVSTSMGANWVWGPNDAYSFIIETTNVTRVEVTSTGTILHTPGARSSSPGTTGVLFNSAAATHTDNATAASGTAAANVSHAIQRPTFAASNLTVTITDAAVLYIANSPAAGTNVTITNPWAIWVDAGNVRFDDNIVWRSGTSFNLTFDHALTAARTHTFPDLTGTVVVADTGTPTNGQIPIGRTGNTPLWATLTQGAGMTITNASGAITLAASGNFVLRGTQQTTELTTTSTSANQSLQTIGSLSIPATSGLFITWRMRKSAGAAAAAYQGLKINTTNVHVTNSGFSWAGFGSSTNQAEDAESWCWIPPRGTNYSRGGMMFTSNGIANTLGTGTFASAALGTASITDVTIMGHSGDAAITTGCNYLTVYEVTGA